MNDMFSVLLLYVVGLPRKLGTYLIFSFRLRKIGRDQLDQNGLSIEQRLRVRMGGIAEDIEKYSAVCDTFSKKRTIGKCNP